ncbi:DoxX family protein [Leptospira levettii]|uniref:DoxX family protein n=1 Tax=Leptospira levettii TaxID=2023178 RepID=A0A5F2AK43_9LEPT|nr:DoxX family protein [Leptospira levettii]PKA23069.1 DoxX-like family protein [Leptospira sp. mixed culture ATI2-C-A1]MCG6149475.1 DoxX family protein [Leptospira levettii]MCW7467314.1 DoxX family protein [Leptospira levettii]MCW7497994.1 DoxX family protein [Leptospira levettii]MCW7509666.1 DoxX family protein [Leptospira levettii]
MSEKTNKILYWFFTLWLSLGMSSTAIVQLLKLPEEVEKINQLGYPTYFLTLLGVWKLLGVIAVLVPKFLLLKEWAYAGFFFAMSGAAISHIVCGHPITEVLPSVLLLSLTVISWYLRPENRKVKS